MGITFDLDYWSKRYENDYDIDLGGNYPIYVDENGIEIKEKSPYFEKMSKTLQKRGFLLKKEFVSIGKWKSPRQIHNYEANSEELVEKTTRKVLQEKNERKKVKSLISGKLKGVKIPVASAILTIINPDKYCIIDYRAWRALKWLQNISPNNTLVFNSYQEYSNYIDSLDSYRRLQVYLDFLELLRSIARNHGVKPRQIEMALWKFDKMKGIKAEE